MVKKYKLDAFDSLVAKDDGYLVYDDNYQTIEAERDALNKDNAALREQIAAKDEALRETTELLDGVEDDFVELDIRKRKNKRLVEDIHKDRYDNAVNNLMKDL